MHTSFIYVLLILILIVAAAMLARWLSNYCKQPSVLGELLLGILIGNVGYMVGDPLFVLIMHVQSVGDLLHQAWTNVYVQLQTNPPGIQIANHQLPDVLTEAASNALAPNYVIAAIVLAALAQLGVLVLLFSAGLESDLRRMSRLWRPASSVALVGVVAPFSLGFTACYLLHPNMSMPGHLFLAATLAATSVGITARVFEDLGHLQTREADVILGAAVIDDILGLVLLAIVVDIVSNDTVDAIGIGKTVIIAAVFLSLVLMVGERVVAQGAKLALKLDHQNGRLLFPLGLMLATAWVANIVQLAPIVGAYAAGLITKERQFPPDPKATTITQQIAPIQHFLAPIFFLFVGMQVNAAYFLTLNTLLLALAFTGAAVLGKLIAGLAAGRNLDRLTIGLGMVPRGEVGLIFVSVGRGLGVLGDSMFSSLIVVIVVTTLATPPALKWSLSRQDQSTRETE